MKQTAHPSRVLSCTLNKYVVFLSSMELANNRLSFFNKMYFCVMENISEVIEPCVPLKLEAEKIVGMGEGG